MSYNWTSSGLIGELDANKDAIQRVMNRNIRMIDQLLPRSVIGQVAVLPGSPANGDAYILTTDNSINVWDNGQWSKYGPRKGFAYIDENLKEFLYYNGMAWESFALFPAGSQFVDSVVGLPGSGLDLFAGVSGGELRFYKINTKDGLTISLVSNVITIGSAFKFAVAADNTTAQALFESAQYKGAALNISDEGSYYYYNLTDSELRYWAGSSFLPMGGGSTPVNIGGFAEVFKGVNLGGQAEMRTVQGSPGLRVIQNANDIQIVPKPYALRLTTPMLGGLTLMTLENLTDGSGMYSALARKVEDWLTANGASYGLPTTVFDFKSGDIIVDLDWGYSKLVVTPTPAVDPYSYSFTTIRSHLSLQGNDGLPMPNAKARYATFKIANPEEDTTYIFGYGSSGTDFPVAAAGNWVRRKYNSILKAPNAVGYNGASLPNIVREINIAGRPRTSIIATNTTYWESNPLVLYSSLAEADSMEYFFPRIPGKYRTGVKSKTIRSGNARSGILLAYDPNFTVSAETTAYLGVTAFSENGAYRADVNADVSNVEFNVKYLPAPVGSYKPQIPRPLNHVYNDCVAFGPTTLADFQLNPRIMHYQFVTTIGDAAAVWGVNAAPSGLGDRVMQASRFKTELKISLVEI